RRRRHHRLALGRREHVAYAEVAVGADHRERRRRDREVDRLEPARERTVDPVGRRVLGGRGCGGEEQRRGGEKGEGFHVRSFSGGAAIVATRRRQVDGERLSLLLRLETDLEAAVVLVVQDDRPARR